MADRHTEKKDNKPNPKTIPVVTPDRRQQQGQRNVDDRRYKAELKWSNPYSLLGQTDQPKRATPKTREETRIETKSRRSTYKLQLVA